MNRPDADETRAHWDALAPDYDDAKDRNAVYHRALMELLDAWVPADARGRVLEVGCGTGRLLAHLRPGTGVGVDASPRMIEHATARAADRPELSFRTLDATRVDTLVDDAAPFDAVVSVDLLEHVPDWRAVLVAMTRAAAPGGRIVVMTPSPLWAAPLFVLETLRLKMPEGPHAFVGGRGIAGELGRLGGTIRHRGTHLVLPVGLAGLGPAVSRLAARLPGLRTLGVIQLVAADMAHP